MSLEDIFRALDAEAESRCREITENAQAQADDIMQESDRRCRELIRARLEQGEQSLLSRARRVVNEAKMERRRAIAAAREEAIDAVFDRAQDALGTLRSNADYPRSFSALLDEALAAASDPSAVLVDPLDEALAEQELKRRSLDLEVRPQLATAGGLIVLDRGGRTRMDNTYERRLARLRTEARKAVGELLFG